ncbi:ribonuclease P protein component [Candidatus Gracilibacteria bacterium]|nr:ribonuclease P protein component [Candidatus Gracilibacteria bacterium]MCF7898525.1 ribonuclease P protein component [Candidatus Paceibacterota bacterium]
MLPKPERLTKSDFVGLRPRTVFRGTFVDIAVSSAPKSRFACVITKKRIKRAVDRNNVKRKIYHIIRDVKPKSPHLVILYPKITTLKSNYSHIKEEITQAFATI